MKSLRALIFFSLTLSLLAACASPQTPESTALPAPSSTLRAYPSETPSPSPYPSDFATATLSPSQTPTLSSVYYTVRDSDDMFGISLFFGVSLEALKTANPEVNPYAMGPGTQLLIPITPTPLPSPTSTPENVPATEPGPDSSSELQTDCYRDGSGGVYCFILVSSPADEALENVSALVTLSGQDGTYQQSQIAIMPLNILPAGEALPLVTYFQPPTPRNFTASAELDFSLPVPPADTRYLAGSISTQRVRLASDGLSAQIEGEIQASDSSRQLGSAWLLAVAYSAEGQVLGIRRWEAAPSELNQMPLPFTLSLYSLGAPIADVELFIELRPALP